jgi:phage I-like protein
LSQLAGYWVDLGSIKLSLQDGRSWIQALPLGSYNHPIWGQIKITPDRVARFAENVNNNVREQDLDIDYDHKAQDGKAAGWIREASDRGAEGLWILVEWTRTAAQALADGEYRYFSPEFADEWVHPKTNITFKDVLFGGALTNRPFLKDILPINLSELMLGEPATKEASAVEELLKQLREALKLGEDVPEDKIMEALKAKLAEPPKVDPPKDQPKAASEDDTELKKLAETNPVIAKLLSDQAESAKKLAVLESANRMSEVTRRLAEVKSAKFEIPPAFVDGMKVTLLKLPLELSDEILGHVHKLCETGLVELGEKPARTTGGKATQGESATDRYSTKVAKLMEDNKGMTYADAASQVSVSDPDLWAEYETEMYQGVTQ